MGGSQTTGPANTTRPATLPTVYGAIIFPALEKHCAQCHGPAKVKGGLRVDSLQAMLKGGTAGPAVIPGDPAGSELLRRITLPPDDEEYMPPDGKSPLPADVVKIIEWWIKDGASPQRGVADLHTAPAEVRQAAGRLSPGK